ncbi:MAG: tail fiber domain-containing protein [Flavobacteriales bacterium]|nr:tail fiber domain-containing protein [Flavobacteriales bacterium]
MKTNVEEFTGEDAADILGQLQPKRYEYLSEFDYMGVPEGTQVGLMAQEVNQVFPAAVASTVVPTQYDEQGVETHASMPVLGIDYEKFVPLLIAGYQAQQATIAALKDQVDAMQQDLSACCESGRVMQGAGSGNDIDDVANDLRNSDATDQRLTITPNPFSEGTVIGYTLPKAGMVSLRSEAMRVASRCSTSSRANRWKARNASIGTPASGAGHVPCYPAGGWCAVGEEGGESGAVNKAVEVLKGPGDARAFPVGQHRRDPPTRSPAPTRCRRAC